MKPTINLKALELVSRDIGDFDSGYKLVDFLNECGVPSHLIEYPNTKWRMIHDALSALSNSTSPSDQEILFKVIEQASHPLMHGGDRIKAKEVQDKFSNYLEFDGYCMDDWKIVKKTPELLNDIDTRQAQRKNKNVRQNEAVINTLNDNFNPSGVQEVKIVGMPEIKFSKSSPEERVDYSDTAGRKGNDRKWNALQTIWTFYNSNSKPESLSISYEHLEPKGSTDIGVMGILEGLSREGCFEGVERNGVIYQLESINETKLKEVYENTRKHKHNYSEDYTKRQNKNNESEGIPFSYNPETGDGQYQDNKFRLTDNTEYRSLFDSCYAVRGKKLPKSEVVKILGFQTSESNNDEVDLSEILSAIGDNKSRRKSISKVEITNKINLVVKTIRSKTGLKTGEFVNNSGNITLNI